MTIPPEYAAILTQHGDGVFAPHEIVTFRGAAARRKALPPMKTHELKCWPAYYAAIVDGRKTFELRYDDRGFAVGDVLRLHEYAPEASTYTGRSCDRVITYLLRGAQQFGIAPGFVVLSLAAPQDIAPYTAAEIDERPEDA